MADGDDELVVRNSIRISASDVDAEVRNADSGNVARIFTDGDQVHVSGTGTSFGADDGDVAALQLYGTSSLSAGVSGGATFRGLVYAPSTETESRSTSISGGARFEGAVISGDVTVSGGSDFVYDDAVASSVRDLDPAISTTGGETRPAVARLNVVAHNVTVEDG